MDTEDEEIMEDTQEEEDLDAVEEAEDKVEAVTPDQDPVTPDQDPKSLLWNGKKIDYHASIKFDNDVYNNMTYNQKDTLHRERKEFQ